MAGASSKWLLRLLLLGKAGGLRNETSGLAGKPLLWKLLRSSAELVSEVITHCAATVCIQLPTFETVAAINRSRKSGIRSGSKPVFSGGISPCSPIDGAGVVAGGVSGGMGISGIAVQV